MIQFRTVRGTRASPTPCRGMSMNSISSGPVDRGDAYTALGRAPILLVGLPRSGTTWLAKIFDSHPDVIYRHEPDESLHRPPFPSFPIPDQFDLYREEAAAYVRRLTNVRTLRAVGTFPVFRKNYRSSISHSLRLVEMVALRLAERAGLSSVTRAIPIPDLARTGSGVLQPTIVKSVNLVGLAGLFVSAIPELRTILIVRHPCGYVASQMRGLREGRFVQDETSLEILSSEDTKRRGLTLKRLVAMPMVEQLAWKWLIYNEKALSDLSGLAGVKVIRYPDLAENAVQVANHLFAFAGIPWHGETERFVHASQHSRSGYRYYGVFRDAAFKDDLDRWRQVLSDDQIRSIFDIVADSRAGQLFGEPSKSVPATTVSSSLTA